MGRVATTGRVETGLMLLEAAKGVLRQNGYSGFSTRDVAARAGVPLSQIHYHFGSKQGLVLALFEHETLNKDQLAKIFEPVAKRPLRPVWLSSEDRHVSQIPPVPSPSERKRLNGSAAVPVQAPQDQAAAAGESHQAGWMPGEWRPRTAGDE